VAALVRVAARRGALYATHMRNEAAGLFDALEEALATARAAGEGARLQVSHLKAGARATWGRAGEAVELVERARAGGLDVAADQYPYAAAATSLGCVLPPALLALPIAETIAALGDWQVRRRVRSEIAGGISGWENVAADPGWDALVLADSGAHPEWAGRSLGDLGRELDRDPADVACDILAADRLTSQVTVHCMAEPDIETILAVPWIAVCTDATGRRPGHPVLDAGRPHPRTYGSAPRVLGQYVRERGVLSLETAVAKLTSVPAARLGLRDRGVVREGAFADLVVFDPATVGDRATYERPAVHPAGIDAVIVNGVVAVRHGVETGVRPGRLLRRA
jgi:dihydroorotase/N-acyl-D-amino-acid deacylase